MEKNPEAFSSSSSSSPRSQLRTSSTTTTPPWLHLPEPLMENILELLPLSSYLRSGSSCRHWHKIQVNHRLRYSPSPPPMLPLPWLISFHPTPNLAICLSPLELNHPSYLLPFPNSLCLNGCTSSILASSNGWLLIALSEFDPCWSLFLVNPISGLQIKLPELKDNVCPPVPIAALSSSSSSSPPDSVILILGWRRVFLFRRGHPGWTILHLPKPWAFISSAIFCRGKYYCFAWRKGIHVLNPSQSVPRFCFFDMDDSQLPQNGERFGRYQLMESNGEAWLLGGESYNKFMTGNQVNLTADERIVPGTSSFGVWKADLETRMWVRVESLADRVLFVGRRSSISLLSHDIGVEGNCVYFSNGMIQALGACKDGCIWKAFGSTNRRAREEPPLEALSEYGLWFLPSLDMVDPSESCGFDPDQLVSRIYCG